MTPPTRIGPSTTIKGAASPYSWFPGRRGSLALIGAAIVVLLGNSPGSAARPIARVAAAPTVSAVSVAVTGSTQADFSGTVDPQGVPTTFFFEYGLDPSENGGGQLVYDNQTAGQDTGSDFSQDPVSASLNGLVPNALYHVRLVANSSDGTTFGADQTFMTGKDRPPGRPKLGKTFDAAVVSGIIFVKPPPGQSLAALDSRPFTTATRVKGRGFVPLTEARQLPMGSQIDARRGSLMVTVASARASTTQTGVFGTALFKLAQKRGGPSKGLATLSLLEGAFPGAPSYASCKAHGARDGGGSAHAARLSARVLQTLHSHVHGAFRTRGRYSAGTVRGTVWDTTDRCDGTFTVVHRGTVVVNDFSLRKTVAVHAGHSYLARALASHHP